MVILLSCSSRRRPRLLFPRGETRNRRWVFSARCRPPQPTGSSRDTAGLALRLFRVESSPASARHARQAVGSGRGNNVEPKWPDPPKFDVKYDVYGRGGPRGVLYEA